MERANGEGFRDKGGGIMGAYSARQIFFCLLNEGEMDLILEKQMCFLLYVVLINSFNTYGFRKLMI